MKLFQKCIPHLAAIAGFIVVSLIYFYPVLQGKKIYQSDIAQYTGMAKEQNDFRATQHAEPYWTNSAFGGMPTYQLGAKYPHDYIGAIDDVLRFLPRPADYLFLYFLGFYLLLMALKIDPLKAFFGALAFGLSTYLIVILGVGHNAKAHAIAYMPMVIAGVIMVFKRNYIWGGLLTLFAAALEINANHFQMTYYLLILLLPIVIFYVWKFIKGKEFRSLAKVSGVFAIAGILAVGANAANLMATAEYTNFSMRGKSELSFNPDGSKDNTTSSMKYDYITEYSYGIAESFNLIAPRLFGGGNGEQLGPDSELYKYAINQGASAEQAKDFTSGLPIYWGDQPIVAAPAYIGAVVFFLCILALFVDKRKVKWAFLAAAILSLLLSWGKNFPALTNFFIDVVPMYDKFRAVSSIQVVLELCIPVLAVMGLQAFFKEDDKAKQWKNLWQAGATAIGIVFLLFLCKGMFEFAGMRDEQIAQSGEQGRVILDLLKEDRRSLYSADLLRSGFLIIIAFGALWLAHKDKLKQTAAVIIVGLVMVGDLFFIDKHYVKNDDRTFVSAMYVDQPFQPTEADLHILQDKSHYRVYDVFGRLQGRSSYFHKAVGGYSAVRPRRMDQLFEYQIDKTLGEAMKTVDTASLSLTRSIPVMNMLNIKYLLFETNDGTTVPVTNPFAYGGAWFVSDYKMVNSADDEMKALGVTDLKNTAIVNKNDLGEIRLGASRATDTVSSITLKTYKSNYASYNATTDTGSLAIFSEMYYPNGWNAYIDGKLTPHFRADYVLRAMFIPAGTHTVEFKFEPQVVKTGSTIALVSFIGILILLIGGIFAERKKLAAQL